MAKMAKMMMKIVKIVKMDHHKAKSMLYTSVDNFKLNEVLNYMVNLTKIDN